MSLGLMTKLYEDNICDAAVDRVDDRPQTWRMRVTCKQTGGVSLSCQLSESRVDEHSSARTALDAGDCLTVC